MSLRLGVPLQQLQQEVTSTEFADYNYYIDRIEPNSFDRHAFQMALIAAEVRRGYAKSPGRVNLDDCLLEFQPPKKSPELSAEERLKKSKSAWLGMVGMSLKEVEPDGQCD